MAKKGLAIGRPKKKKKVFLTAIFKPKIVWHEMFVKCLLNWKRDSKLLQFCSFICLFSK